MCPLYSHKPRPKSFGRAFSKARRVLGRRPESPLVSGEIPLSSVKGRRGELSCQSNSRGESTRSEGFSFICAQILYTVQTASTSSVTRDFASQNVSLRERDCHLPHGGRLKNAPFCLQKRRSPHPSLAILLCKMYHFVNAIATFPTGEG